MLWYTLNTDGTITYHVNDVGAIYAGAGIVRLPEACRVTVSAMRTTHKNAFGLGIYAGAGGELFGFMSYCKENITLQVCTTMRTKDIAVNALSMTDVGDYVGGFAPKEKIGSTQSIPSTPIEVNCTVFI